MLVERLFWKYGVILFLIIPIFAVSQSGVDSSIFKGPQIRYASIITQNDWYQKHLQSDKYFTNGLHVEYADKFLNNKASRVVLLNPFAESQSQFSLRFGQDMYTPLNIYLASVDSTDIPYSAALYFVYEREVNDIQNFQKWVSKLHIGIQGPAAGAGELQKWYHEISNSPIPNGWGNQIENGLILDYEIKYQKMLPISYEYLEVNWYGQARLGTYQTNVNTGLEAKVGLFNSSYFSKDGMFNPSSKEMSYTHENVRWSRNNSSKLAKKRKARLNGKWQFYGLLGLNVGSMLYNGAVQGSLVNFRVSPYVYSWNDYSHQSHHLMYGGTLSYKNFWIQYKRYVFKDPYKDSGYFGWGQIQGIYCF